MGLEATNFLKGVMPTKINCPPINQNVLFQEKR